MALNNIDTQFAVARSEIRALLKHVNPDTTVGGQACDALQGMVDALESIQNDSFRHGTSSFFRHPVDKPIKMNGMKKTFSQARSGLRRVKTFTVLETPEGRQMNEEINTLIDRLHELEDPNTVPGGLDPDRHEGYTRN
jgi:hypothetical protein